MSKTVQTPLALLAGVALAATVTSFAPAGSTPDLVPASASAGVLAPYVDMGAHNLYPDALGAITEAGLRSLTAGFVISGGGCKPTWDDGISLAKDTQATRFLATARSDGATEIISFGGAGGRKLSETCHSAKRLASVYESVAKRYKTWRLDFDIEGHELADHSAVVREVDAIKRVQRAHPAATLSLTVPVDLDGLPSQVEQLLRLAAKAKVKLPLVNLMTMDFGGKREMGKASINAVEKAFPQIRKIYPSATWRRIGVTPMIGVNDVRSEVFTLDDAQLLAEFDFSHQLGRLSFWALSRDRQCAHTEKDAQENCSGVDQQSYAFTTMLS